MGSDRSDQVANTPSTRSHLTALFGDLTFATGLIIRDVFDCQWCYSRATMSTPLIWLFGYLLPASAACSIALIFPRRMHGLFGYQLAVMHAMLCVSIFITQYRMLTLGITFPWHADLPSLFYYGVSIGIASCMLGALGAWYGLSAFVQQLTMLSIAFVLMRTFPIVGVVLLIMPVYVGCHFFGTGFTLLRIILFAVWGAASICIFWVTSDFWLTAAVHTLLGSLLIRYNILYRPYLYSQSSRQDGIRDAP
jgi:hypothetical protein